MTRSADSPRLSANTMSVLGALSGGQQMERIETAGADKMSTMFAAYRSKGVQRIWDHPDGKGLLDKCIGRLDGYEMPRGGPNWGKWGTWTG